MRYRQLWVVWPLGFLLLLIFARTREQRVDQEENTVRQRNPWCGGASRENGKGRVRREVRDGVRDLGRGGNKQSCGKGGEEEKSLASRCVCAGVPTPHPDLGPRHGYHHWDRAGRGHSLLLVVSWTRNQLGEIPMALVNWPSDRQLPRVSMGHPHGHLHSSDKRAKRAGEGAVPPLGSRDDPEMG